MANFRWMIPCAALVCAGSVLAQPEPREQPPGRTQPPFRGGGAPDRERMGQMMAGTAWAYMGVLDEDQRASMRELLMGQREKMRELEEKLRKARLEVMDTALGEKFDESAVRKKALEQAKIEAEISVLRAKALSQVKPPLTPEQVERLKNPPAPQFGAPREGMRRPQGRPDPNDLPPRPEGDSPRGPGARPPAER